MLDFDVDVKKCVFTIKGTYPDVPHVCVDKENNEWSSSTRIIDKELMKSLRGMRFSWTFGSEQYHSFFTLEVRRHNKRVSIQKLIEMADILDDNISLRIQELIDLKCKYDG